MSLIKLGDCLTIQEVSELTLSLQNVFDSGLKIAIEANELQRIDGAGMQLLCVLFKEAESHDIEIGWSSESDIIRKSAIKMGLDNVLKLQPITL